MTTPLAKQYGNRFLVSLVPGDGIGREVCKAVKQLFEAAQVPVDFETVNVSGFDCKDERDASGRLNQVLDSLRRNKVGLKGTPTGSIDP